jgi:hypothetical protein
VADLFNFFGDFRGYVAGQFFNSRNPITVCPGEILGGMLRKSRPRALGQATFGHFSQNRSPIGYIAEGNLAETIDFICATS